MRSSTSSSEWLKTWVLAGALVVVVLGGWECLLRARGHRPTIVDSPSLWSYWRGQAVGDKAVVVLGDSRSQLGWSNEACEEVLPGCRAVQLALNGLTSPVAVLRDLSEDNDFSGLVVMCVSERSFLPSLWDLQAPYVATYHRKWNLNNHLNMMASCALHNTLTLLHPLLKLDPLMTHIARYKTLPPVFYLDTFANRNQRADYSKADLAALRQKTCASSAQDARPVAPEEWVANALALEPYVKAIQQRGGRVAYVRFPMDGRLWEIFEEAYPKRIYWDALAARTSATCVHFKDYPSLQFPCPDFSHLNGPDAAPFTAALVRILTGRGAVAAK